MIYQGQRLIEAEAADGSVGVAVTRASRKGERFVLARTADDGRVPIFVTGARRTGSRLVRAKTADGITVAVKFEPDWVPAVDEPKVWRGTAVSATGKYMMAVESNKVWRSANYGESFSLAHTTPEVYEQSGVEKSYDLYDCYMSASGEHAALVPLSWGLSEDAGTRPHDGWIRVSDDYGATWTLVTYTVGIASPAYGVAISASGQYMTLSRLNAVPRYSHDYGVTWANSGSTDENGNGQIAINERNALRMTADGATQIAFNRRGWVAKSTDYGQNFQEYLQWSETGGTIGRSDECMPLAMSDDGTHLIAMRQSRIAYVSTDSGATLETYNAEAGPNRTEYIAASSDMSYIGTGGSLFGTVGATLLSTMLRTASKSYDDWASQRDGSEDQIVFPSPDGERLTGLSMSANGLYWLAGTSRPIVNESGLLYLSRDFGRKGDFVELPEPE